MDGKVRCQLICVFGADLAPRRIGAKLLGSKGFGEGCLQQLRWCGWGQEGGNGHMQDPEVEDIRKRGEDPRNLTNPNKRSQKRQQCLGIVKDILSEGYFCCVCQNLVGADFTFGE